MGLVWKAQHVELSTPAAVKLIDPLMADSDEALVRFKREAKHDEVDDYNSLRPISTAGFVVGGVGVAGGLTLLLTAPKRPETEAHVSPWLGLGSAGVSGRF
jgi:hypothetical protein